MKTKINILLACLLAFAIPAFAQTTNAPGVINLGGNNNNTFFPVGVDTNGVLLSPSQFWAVNSASINAQLSGGGATNPLIVLANSVGTNTISGSGQTNNSDNNAAVYIQDKDGNVIEHSLAIGSSITANTSGTVTMRILTVAGPTGFNVDSSGNTSNASLTIAPGSGAGIGTNLLSGVGNTNTVNGLVTEKIDNTGAVTAKSFTGNGSGLTNLLGNAAPTVTTNAQGHLGANGVASLATVTGSVNAGASMIINWSSGTGALAGQLFSIAYGTTYLTTPIPVQPSALSSNAIFAATNIFLTNLTTSGCDVFANAAVSSSTNNTMGFTFLHLTQ